MAKKRPLALKTGGLGAPAQAILQLLAGNNTLPLRQRRPRSLGGGRSFVGGGGGGSSDADAFASAITSVTDNLSNALVQRAMIKERKKEKKADRDFEREENVLNRKSNEAAANAQVRTQVERNKGEMERLKLGRKNLLEDREFDSAFKGVIDVANRRINAFNQAATRLASGNQSIDKLEEQLAGLVDQSNSAAAGTNASILHGLDKINRAAQDEIDNSDVIKKDREQRDRIREQIEGRGGAVPPTADLPGPKALGEVENIADASSASVNKLVEDAQNPERKAIHDMVLATGRAGAKPLLQDMISSVNPFGDAPVAANNFFGTAFSSGKFVGSGKGSSPLVVAPRGDLVKFLDGPIDESVGGMVGAFENGTPPPLAVSFESGGGATNEAFRAIAQMLPFTGSMQEKAAFLEKNGIDASNLTQMNQEASQEFLGNILDNFSELDQQMEKAIEQIQAKTPAGETIDKVLDAVGIGGAILDPIVGVPMLVGDAVLDEVNKPELVKKLEGLRQNLDTKFNSLLILKDNPEFLTMSPQEVNAALEGRIPVQTNSILGSNTKRAGRIKIPPQFGKFRPLDSDVREAIKEGRNLYRGYSRVIAGKVSDGISRFNSGAVPSIPQERMAAGVRATANRPAVKQQTRAMIEQGVNPKRAFSSAVATAEVMNAMSAAGPDSNPTVGFGFKQIADRNPGIAAEQFIMSNPKFSDHRDALLKAKGIKNPIERKEAMRGILSGIASDQLARETLEGAPDRVAVMDLIGRSGVNALDPTGEVRKQTIADLRRTDIPEAELKGLESTTNKSLTLSDLPHKAVLDLYSQVITQTPDVFDRTAGQGIVNAGIELSRKETQLFEINKNRQQAVRDRIRAEANFMKSVGEKGLPPLTLVEPLDGLIKSMKNPVAELAIRTVLKGEEDRAKDRERKIRNDLGLGIGQPNAGEQGRS